MPHRANATIETAGHGRTAPGQLLTVSATVITTAVPQPMGTKANSSSPTGMRISANIPHGMTHKAVTGMAPRFAASP